MTAAVPAPAASAAPQGVRDWLANLVLAALLLGLPLATITVPSRQLFSLGAALNLLFALALLPEVATRLRAWSRMTGPRLAVLVTLAILACWQNVQGPMWDVERLGWFATLPLLFAAALGWFARHDDAGLARLAFWKLLILSIAIGWICGLAALGDWGLVERQRFGPTPIFRHIRSLNDEIPWLLALAGWLYVGADRRAGRWLPALALLASGYVSVWSASRGQWLAVAVLAGLLLGRRSLPWRQPAVWQAALWALAGALLAVALGQADRLLAMVGRSVGTAGIGALSGRDWIWDAAVEAVSASPWTWLAGLGPDAFARLALDAPYRHLTGPIIQPHNTLVLWLLEFGLAGTALLLLGWAVVLRAAWRRLRPAETVEPTPVVAAILIAQSVFSLFTGIAYHTMPATFMLLLAAWLLSRPPSE